MFDPQQIHIVTFGYDRVMDYYLHMDIIRQNYEFGNDLWITTVYNGDNDKLASGFGENNFIYIKENRGAVGGVIDVLNIAGVHAYNMRALRPIVVFLNFDSWFITGEGFKTAIEEFIESDKNMSAAVDNNRLPAPDCMIFKSEFLYDLLPIDEKVWSIRKNIPELVEKYRPTKLGFENVEEYLLYTLIDVYGMHDKIINDAKEHNDLCIDFLLEKCWHDMKRDGLPRLEWTERIKFLHCHDMHMKRNLLKSNGITKGRVIQELLK